VKRLLLRHTALRRPVTLPAFALLLVVTVVLAPIAVVVGGLLALRPGGRGRIARIALFMLAYQITELVGLFAAGWLWVRAGLGRRIGSQRSVRAHYALLAALLRRLYAVGSALVDLRVDPPTAVTAEGADMEGAAASDSPGSSGEAGAPMLPPAPGRPVLVLSRHAGPGDSFLLVHALFALAHRRPRIVLKEDLRLDPVIDVLVGRLPHCFIGREPNGGARAAEEIRRITATMGPTDALLVFPEGGNFTPRRRQRAIAGLRRRGLTRASARARRLRNVLPPQPAGVFAAIDAAPHADLVFVAHTGLDHMQTVRQVWQGIPLTHPVEVTWWTVPTERVPDGEDARLRWLDENWARIDAWISRTQPTQPLV